MMEVTPLPPFTHTLKQSPLANFFATILFRSREFLWQEGHTAFATKEEADEEVQMNFIFLYCFDSSVGDCIMKCIPL